MTVGPKAGTHYILDPQGECRIGRDLDCAVVLTDPLCSRVHAVVNFQEGHWRVRDVESRNGTYVNGQKIDEASMTTGHSLRIGSTEFLLEASERPPSTSPSSDLNMTQTVVKDTRVGDVDLGQFAIGALQDPEHARDLVTLYQLSIKMLGATDPQELIRVALELLNTRTRASVVGFLWLDDSGRFQPKLVIPSDTPQPIELNEDLTQLVARKGHAVWIANQQSSDSNPQQLEHYADALCVPLVREREVLGAIHVYLERGKFRQAHFDFVISVANIAAVALNRALKEGSLASDLQRLKEKSPGYDELIGGSSPMQGLKDKIARLGRASGCVLIRGESGTGKELVARAVHQSSPRANRPMLAVNCAAIPSELVDSQLFGHRAGAFTSADRDHVGFFQQADLGTLFLDEIGELPLAAQSKLLRVLEGHPFLTVGGSQEIRVDVRVLAATNRDLLSYVREKKFREDLYYRLAVFELVLPPLRERGKDVELLIDYFMEHFCRQHGRGGLKLSPEARAKLLQYSWPGNVRQLRNVIDSAVVLAGGKQIEVGDLGIAATVPEELDTLRLDDWERRLIAEALRRADQNIPEAAKLLGIGRATLYRKLDESNAGKRQQ
ncbi:MAG: sigma 54-interacting transcriptional regulator [Planctomycetes bacterium]|nr:sigma 54-interacting transcriptional regulator [Planctomycetota bacterium]